MKKIIWLILFTVISIVLTILWQYNLYQKLSTTDMSCGGDWSYNVKCPLGSYCRSSNQKSLAGGLCKPILSPLFDIISESGETSKPKTGAEQTQKTANEKVAANSLTDLFKYIEKIDNSKLSNTQVEAWKVEINTNLLTDKNIKTFQINLFDGRNYEVERNEEQMQNSICDSQQCTWIGYISGRSCIVKNTVTGKCSPGESITFILNNDTIAGTIPAVVGVNQYVYSVSGMTNDPGPFLIKINPSKFGPD